MDGIPGETVADLAIDGYGRGFRLRRCDTVGRSGRSVHIHYLQHVEYEGIAGIGDWAEERGHQL